LGILVVQFLPALEHLITTTLDNQDCKHLAQHKCLHTITNCRVWSDVHHLLQIPHLKRLELVCDCTVTQAKQKILDSLSQQCRARNIYLQLHFPY